MKCLSNSLAIERQVAWGERNPATRRLLMGETGLGRLLATKCSPRCFWHHKIERNGTWPTRFSFSLNWLSAQPIKICKKLVSNQLQHRYPPPRPGPETQWISGGGSDYSTKFSEFAVISGVWQRRMRIHFVKQWQPLCFSRLTFSKIIWFHMP